jgi:exosortase A-associated hydrolase 1
VKVFEEPALFDCDGHRLVGMLHRPSEGIERGVLLIVGGPQYRVGSHRQFLLLARHLATSGIPVFRFDYRGMGDSEGPQISFEECQDDIDAALTEFFSRVPDMRDAIVWGLCDAASAAAMYGNRDPRITGMVLVNPWVRTDESVAQTYLRHYYRAKFRDPSFWKELVTGRVDFFGAVGGLWSSVGSAFRARFGKRASGLPAVDESREAEPFKSRMIEGLTRFSGRILFVISGQDLTAAEFMDTVARSKRWSALLEAPNVRMVDFPEANHTFSRREWRDKVASLTTEWVLSE